MLSRRSSILVALALVAALVSMVPAQAAKPKAASAAGSAEKVILFASDGMRPDLMEGYAAEGFMPTYADLMANGVRGDNGLIQAFPPNTGVGWSTLATGTYPGEHGSMNNTFHRIGEGTFNNRTSLRHDRTAAGRHDPAGGGARGEEDRLRRMGGLAHHRRPRWPGRSSTSATSSRRAAS